MSDEAQKQGIRVTLLAFLIKAAVAALKQYPQFNASLSPDGESLVLKQYYHIGVAVDTPNGLVVPVIRDCDKKGVLQLAKELGEVSAKARDGKLSPDRYAGRMLLDLQPRRHRRHQLHADHQRAGSGDPGRVALGHEAGLEGRRSSCRG